MGEKKGDAEELRACARSENGRDYLRRGLPNGDTVFDGVCIFHGKLEPAGR